MVLTLTYLDVDGCVAVHPHRKHSILENHSDLIQQLLLQCGTVELLVVVIHRKQMVTCCLMRFWVTNRPLLCSFEMVEVHVNTCI